MHINELTLNDGRCAMCSAQNEIMRGLIAMGAPSSSSSSGAAPPDGIRRSAPTNNLIGYPSSSEYTSAMTRDDMMGTCPKKKCWKPARVGYFCDDHGSKKEVCQHQQGCDKQAAYGTNKCKGHGGGIVSHALKKMYSSNIKYGAQV
jgi:hypothetical protein